MARGRINVYTCDTCGGQIVTVDRDEGVTPFMLTCRFIPEYCDGSMVSALYRVDQLLKPTHEWYKPDKPPQDPAMRQHVEMGGLLIRRIASEGRDKQGDSHED